MKHDFPDLTIEVLEEQLELIERIGKEAHSGQTYRGSSYYHKHCEDVAKRAVSFCVGMRYTKEQLLCVRIVSLGHDVLEDGNFTQDDLMDKGLHYWFIDKLIALDKGNYPDNAAYIKAMFKHIVLWVTKHSDSSENLKYSIEDHAFGRIRKYAGNIHALMDGQTKEGLFKDAKV